MAPRSASAWPSSALRAAPTPQGDLDADDVLDLIEYFDTFFAGVTAELRTDYWREAIDLAPRLSGHDRARLWSVLWYDFQPFTDLYLTLLRRAAEALLRARGAARHGRADPAREEHRRRPHARPPRRRRRGHPAGAAQAGRRPRRGRRRAAALAGLRTDRRARASPSPRSRGTSSSTPTCSTSRAPARGSSSPTSPTWPRPRAWPKAPIRCASSAARQGRLSLPALLGRARAVGHPALHPRRQPGSPRSLRHDDGVDRPDDRRHAGGSHQAEERAVPGADQDGSRVRAEGRRDRGVAQAALVGPPQQLADQQFPRRVAGQLGRPAVRQHLLAAQSDGDRRAADGLRRHGRETGHRRDLRRPRRRAARPFHRERRRPASLRRSGARLGRGLPGQRRRRRLPGEEPDPGLRSGDQARPGARPARDPDAPPGRPPRRLPQRRRRRFARQEARPGAHRAARAGGPASSSSCSAS